jgi:hypothetical protein
MKLFPIPLILQNGIETSPLKNKIPLKKNVCPLHWKPHETIISIKFIFIKNYYQPSSSFTKFLTFVSYN